MQNTPTTVPPEEERDFGRTPESLKQTLRSSKLTSELFDPPLPPPESLDPVKPRPRSRYWSLRLYLSVSTLLTLLVICITPHAVLRPVLTTQGLWIIGILAAFSLAGVLDVVGNDLRLTCWLHVLREQRHTIYIGQALGILAFAYAIVRSIGWSPMLLMFVDDLVVALAIAPLDMLVRHREERKA